MGLQGYVGSAEDQNRIRMLERQREEERERIEKAKEESKSKPVGFRNWQQATTEVIESALKADTIGLISRDEYLQRKATVQARLEVHHPTYHFQLSPSHLGGGIIPCSL
jgi:protein FAM50